MHHGWQRIREWCKKSKWRLSNNELLTQTTCWISQILNVKGEIISFSLLFRNELFSNTSSIRKWSFFSVGAFWKVINIFACTCPNRSGVGAIDNPGRFEQALDQYYIPEVLEEIFTHDISMFFKSSKIMGFIFCNLKKAQQTWI